MKILRIATTTLFLISGLFETNAQKIAIQAGNLILPDQEKVLKDQVSLVENGRIKSFGKRLNTDGYETVDLSDSWVAWFNGCPCAHHQ